jgi:hypothetical protein
MPRRLPTVAASLAALALLGAGADQAAASYSGTLQAGTVTLTGDNAGDKVALRLRSGAPDAGGDDRVTLPDLSDLINTNVALGADG